MSGFLLDTNCISELLRPKPDAGVLAWMELADERMLHLSDLTFGEIRKGLALLPQGKRRTRLEVWLEVELQARFAGRIVPIDASVADRWGQIAADAERKGRGLPVIDGLLAATALHHNMTVVTRNVGDFASSQIRVVNPWEA